MRSILELKDIINYVKDVTGVGNVSPQDQYANKSMEWSKKDVNGNLVKGEKVDGLTKSEVDDRQNFINYSPKHVSKLDLKKRREIIDVGGETTAKKSTGEKAIDAISSTSKTAYDHISSNLPAYGGVAAAGLGAYGLYKYLKKKKLWDQY